MRKKGFTLIELLAVIVILAIIALIATPIVMNVIEKSRKGAAERGAENYIDAVETAVTAQRIDGNVLDGEYTIQSDGSLCEGTNVTNCEKPIKIDMSGNKPSGGSIFIDNGIVLDGSILEIGDYVANIIDGVAKIDDFGTIIENNNIVGQSAGTPTLTYNPVTQEKGCTQDNIDCLGWYVLEDKGNEYAYVTLIMDRNFKDEVVPEKVAWCIDGGNNNTTCQNINSTAEGTPLKHIQDRFGNNVAVSFPTAEQIATAAGKTISGSEIIGLPAWLVSSGASYWTASPWTTSSYAWSVYVDGFYGYRVLGEHFVNQAETGRGLRPVITIPKYKLD